jgi:DNA-binding response OmpR family regulator
MTDRCYATLSVLFADDAETAGAHYTEFLSHIFHRVYRAHDGEAAWELYKEHRPDIVLLDIKMPKMSGLQIAEKIREHDPETRIIIATAYTDETHLLQAVELGLTRFLSKPFNRNDFKAALDKAVREVIKTCSVDLGEGCSWDRKQNRLTRFDQEVSLTSKERTLLSLLSSHPGQTVTFSTIELSLWPDTYDGTDIVPRIKALVKRLRKKLPEGCIKNVYGEGYRIPDLH